MKKKAPFLSLLLALLLMFSVSMAVSAAPVPKTDGEAPAISQAETGTPDSADSENIGTDISAVQGETPSVPEAQDGVESEAEAVDAPRKSNNTPFFVGAGIAVLVFIGVALYCNKNGNKTF